MKKSQNDFLYKVGKHEQFTDSINFKKANKLPKMKLADHDAMLFHTPFVPTVRQR